MKRLLTILLSIFLCATAAAQIENSIVLDTKSFRAVQTNELTGAVLDPIGTDHSRRACARLKIFFHKMTREQLAEVDAIFPSGTIQMTKIKVADYENILILEMTARPNVRFYLSHPRYGTSNEVELSLEGNKEYQIEASLNQSFSIVVRSNVEGAEVYIDNIYKGKTDSSKSLTIRDVMTGSYDLRLVYANVRYNRRIEVNSGSISFEQNIDTEAAEAQYVVFQVVPETAVVVIDNKPYTPVGGAAVAVLKSGVHTYSVSAKMYHTQQGSFTVEGKKFEKSITLDPAYGYLYVSGNSVAGATVFVDEEKIGIAPVKSGKLASGEHSVRIIKEKFNPYAVRVNIEDNQTVTLSPTLSANYATVTLSVADNAAIWINGTQKGVGSWTGELAAGTYIIETRKDGHRSARVTKDFSSIPARQSYKLPAPTPIVGSLDITSTPPLAKVTIDGSQVGTTPIKVGDVLVGTHTVTISREGYSMATKTVTVYEGKTTSVTATLTKKESLTLSDLGGEFQIGDVVSVDGVYGIVFQISPLLKLVSVKEGTTTWGGYGTDMSMDDTEYGFVNVAKTKYLNDWQKRYPAIKWCETLGKDWYLPAINELKEIYNHKDKINSVLRANGMSTLGSNDSQLCLWSSTEQSRERAYCVKFADQSSHAFYKDSNHAVRAVFTLFASQNNTISKVTTPIKSTKPAASTTTKRYKVGDYYSENGKRGVVFSVSADGCHGKIVSVSEVCVSWGGQGVKIGATDVNKGKTNTSKIKSISGWQTKYQAVRWCSSLGSGWYLPSVYELKAIYDKRDKIDSTLISKGFETIGAGATAKWFWSSSESDAKYAYGVDFNKGLIGDKLKGECYMVRAVATF